MQPNTTYDVIVIGGGPAGMSAAIKAYEACKGKVLLIERNDSLGGILPQCIHNGFGAVNFGNDLPGPEYAYRYEVELRKLPVDILLDTIVVDLTADHQVYAMNSTDGYLHYKAKAIVLAMGCRERTRAQIRLPGTRSAGIFTAGTVQRLVNIEGYMPGNEVVILGSGDIGMIMARRMSIEGAKVHAVLELLPYLTGLRRNYVQCLQDYGIPLHLSTTVNKIYGDKRVEGIETVKVDENLQAVPGTEEFIKCDTLLLSVGLIPENELSRKAGVQMDPRTNGPIVDSDMATNVPGIYAAGNVTAIYDLADYVSKAGEVAGQSAAKYAESAARRDIKEHRTIRLKPGANIGSIIPQEVFLEQNQEHEVLLTMRPNSLMERMVKVELTAGDETVVSFREQYARPAEMIVHKLKAKDFEKLLSTDATELVASIS
ncbi:Thioredoxin reductase [Alkalispirochaeta americana]|uniref:Thioredoxin reductase n=1 Tax=Alkalispirochaeta americana TaxID=159291 RepID=A0A1N6VRL1_9SPIO|nr:NAD(P)/FAD-dependent oxidoreductase [Alkalispirochaeta americana]SIQ80501.1 Thioredoxin reductase [Alkalispirochaeta americana]